MIIKYAVQRGYRPPYTQLDLSGLIPRKPRTPKVIPKDIPATFKRIGEYPEGVMRYANQASVSISFLLQVKLWVLSGRSSTLKSRNGTYQKSA